MMFNLYLLFVVVFAFFSYADAGGESFQEFCFRICAPCSDVENTFGCDCSILPYYPDARCEVPSFPLEPEPEPSS
ncbi:unnamed protein product [Chironomus riparius]|uniref:Uncharacterized protein n=1 Tax=Chironomus riparius TaxID=315576 RepID=A0A9N9SA06_9DIPT|nr:unnamed protein product [Chironomus riparius]